MARGRRIVIVAALAAALVAAAPGLSASGASTPGYKGASAPVDARVADLLSRMTLAEKVGQMTQVDRQFLATQGDIASSKLGSLLSGGGSVPEPNKPSAWVAMTNGFQREALKTRLAIPLLYGIDAVHG